MICPACQDFEQHQQASMAMYRAGFCGCAKQPSYVYMTKLYERQCVDFLMVGGK